jgi:hypothetical protein
VERATHSLLRRPQFHREPARNMRNSNLESPETPQRAATRIASSRMTRECQAVSQASNEESAPNLPEDRSTQDQEEAATRSPIFSGLTNTQSEPPTNYQTTELRGSLDSAPDNSGELFEFAAASSQPPPHRFRQVWTHERGR